MIDKRVVSDGFNKNNKDKMLLGALFLTALIIHFSLVIYASNNEAINFFENLSSIISSAYSEIGFKWKGHGAYVVTVALTSSLVLNSIRRFIEGVFFGWPQFNLHDGNSTIRALTLMLFYGAIMYFAVGFFGEKYSSRRMDLINVFLIAASTYIVGLIVNLVDEFISGVYSMFCGAKS